MAAELFYANVVQDGSIPVNQRVDRLGPFATYDEAHDAGDCDGVLAYTIDKVFIPDAIADQGSDEDDSDVADLATGKRTARPVTRGPVKKAAKKAAKKASSK